MAKLVSVLVVVLASGISMIHGGSISSVSVQKHETQPSSSITKSLGMINLPQVPEFPKLGGRPGKNPSSSHSAPLSNQNSQHGNQQKPQSQQSQHDLQQTTVHEVQEAQHAYTSPAAYPSSYQQDVEVVYDSNVPESDEDHRDDNQEDYVSEPFHEINVGEIETTYQHYEQGAYSSIKNEESSINKNADADDIHIPLQPEKSQESMADFPMPMHVMTILNALGSGGSLAQATKPEKDGVGTGYTTANAIGYATGDNATVTASVSNKMELNTATVILTESASASASSMSNGTAFSQATLASNGYTSQFGPGANPGNGWKSNNKNPPIPVFQ